VVRPVTDGLDAAARDASEELRHAHAAREIALPACRAVIQASGRSIRATHRGESDDAAALAHEARGHLDRAQAAVRGSLALNGAGFLHDAEKEYAEAVLFAALVGPAELPGHTTIGVAAAAWLNGLAEAASELRRHLLDTLRGGDLGRAEDLLDVMDDVYGVLVTVDYPDAVTGGLRRTTDAFRAVLERTRSDLTTTVLQSRLQSSLERAMETATRTEPEAD
jgi:translin